jgi:hypothetical protein
MKQFPGRIAEVEERRAVVEFQVTVIGCYPQLAQFASEFGGLHELTPFSVLGGYVIVNGPGLVTHAG